MNKPYALITGASGGIGEELARQMASRYSLILVARSADKLNTLAQELGGAQTIALDLSAPDAAHKLYAELEQRGLEVEVLVNNAGFADFGEFAQAESAKLEQMIFLNIGTLTMLTRVLLPKMLAKKRGQVVNIASTAAFMPGPLMAVYYASKAYVLSLGEALDEELKGTGVGVTTICPGPVATGFQDRAAMHDSKLLKNPINPMMTVQEVAKETIQAFESKQRMVIPGLMNKLLALTPRLMPRAFVPTMVKNAQARGH
jgi:uncharacterized protein